MGEPAGIGPEIILKAWLARRSHALAPFAVYGTLSAFQDRAHLLHLDVPVIAVDRPFDALDHFGEGLPVLALPSSARAEAGRPKLETASAVVASIDRAIGAVRNGEARAIVTAPIAKSVLYAAGFKHPGHTEYLAERAKQLWPSEPCVPVMMLASSELRVVPLTIHVPLKDVPALLTRALIERTVRITWEALRTQFGCENPRIAISGLNPHAGEEGALGREEIEIIAPAIASLRQEGLAVTGPHAADTMFHAAARSTYDAAIAMYHDQALIPIKTLCFDEGVNVTLGLPFVRTSPDHGTAFDIAAEGRANPLSFVQALKLAQRLTAAPVKSGG